MSEARGDEPLSDREWRQMRRTLSKLEFEPVPETPPLLPRSVYDESAKDDAGERAAQLEDAESSLDVNDGEAHELSSTTHPADLPRCVCLLLVVGAACCASACIMYCLLTRVCMTSEEQRVDESAPMHWRESRELPSTSTAVHTHSFPPSTPVALKLFSSSRQLMQQTPSLVQERERSCAEADSTGGDNDDNEVSAIEHHMSVAQEALRHSTMVRPLLLTARSIARALWAHALCRLRSRR